MLLISRTDGSIRDPILNHLATQDYTGMYSEPFTRLITMFLSISNIKWLSSQLNLILTTHSKKKTMERKTLSTINYWSEPQVLKFTESFRK